MAKFKIELELRGGERVLLTDYDSDREYNINNTSDEQLSEEENDVYTLSFSIIGKVDNINFDSILNINRPLWLTYGRDNKTLKMIITNIQESRKEFNKIYEIEAQDYASAIFLKNNVGLYLDTFEDEDFLNIMKKDAVEKPTVEDIANYILERGWLRKRTGIGQFEGWEALYIRTLDPENPEPPLKYINIEVDNSNTYNGLLEVAIASDTIIRFDYNNKIVKFIDKEEPELSRNFYLKEGFNTEMLEIMHTGNDLSSILYIDSTKNELDEYVFLEDEIEHRDNFLYNLDYYVDAKLITGQDAIDIKNKLEDKSDPDSLYNINLELEEAIKERSEREGIHSHYNTLLETTTYPIFLEDMNSDEFINAYKDFMAVLQTKKTGGKERKFISSIEYLKLKEMEDLTIEDGRATPIELSTWIIRYNNKGYPGVYRNASDDVLRPVQEENVDYIFYFGITPKDTSTHFSYVLIGPDGSGARKNLKLNKNLYVSALKSKFSNNISIFNTRANNWVVVSGKLEIGKEVIGPETLSTYSYPYFENAFFLGGFDFVQEEIDKWAKKGLDFLPDWREEFYNGWNATEMLKWAEIDTFQDWTITPEYKEKEGEKALAEERMANYKLVFGEYEYEGKYKWSGEEETDDELYNKMMLIARIAVWWDDFQQTEFSGRVLSNALFSWDETAGPEKPLHEILNWDGEPYSLPLYVKENISDENNWSEGDAKGQFIFIRDALDSLWEEVKGEPPFNSNREDAISKFFRLMKEKREFWYYLKNTYGQHIFTENYYEDEIETNSKVLYTQAKRAFEDFKKPLEEFSVEYIHRKDIQLLNNIEPKVGDYIIIEGIENKDRKLKIQSVGRRLKTDSETTYEIKKFSPGGRLIEKLIKEVYS